MFNFKNNFLKSIDWLIKANFVIAVMIMMVVAVLALLNSEILFEDSADFTDLYGPLANNLRLILVYVGLAEANILFYCGHRQKLHFLLAVGFFYILMIGGLAAYGQINQIPMRV